MFTNLPTCDVYMLSNGFPEPAVALELRGVLADSLQGDISVNDETIELPGVGVKSCVRMSARVSCEPNDQQGLTDLWLSLSAFADYMAARYGTGVFAHFPGHPHDDLVQIGQMAGPVV